MALKPPATGTRPLLNEATEQRSDHRIAATSVIRVNRVTDPPPPPEPIASAPWPRLP